MVKPLFVQEDLPVVIGNMWFKLAETIEAGIAPAYIDKGPEEAMRFAKCAEACYWQAWGEHDCFEVKEILAEYAQAALPQRGE